MNFREIVKSCCPPLLVSAVRRLKSPRRRPAETGLPVPWSDRYHEHKAQFLGSLLSDGPLLSTFREGGSLPTGFGVGIDERCVEYPWAVSRLPDEAKFLLDAGSTLNHEFLLDLPLWRDRTLHIATLAPEPGCFWTRGVSYLYCDLRSLPIKDALYDTVICISTLEHVGCDNRPFTGREHHHERRPEDFVAAMRELARVLRPGGTLLLTVPYGVHRDYGMQQIFDAPMLDKALAAFEPRASERRSFYRYTSEGWQRSDAQACAGMEYVRWISQSWQDGAYPDPLPVEPDLAAAARAVACLEIVKGR